MYTLYFASKEEKDPRNDRLPTYMKQQAQEPLQLASVQVYEAKGCDVHLTSIMLTVQFFDVCIKARNLFMEYKSVMPIKQGQ